MTMAMLAAATTAAGQAAAGGAVPGEAFTLHWDQLGAGVAAVGSLGLAAFGVTEALGKAFAIAGHGLPYFGFGAVKQAIEPLKPALKVAYGASYMDIITQQYRSGRSTGDAPSTIRNGVRLGLPFMEVAAAARLIGSVWDLDPAYALALAQALQAPPVDPDAPPAPPPTGVATPQALAGRFSTALDARLGAAFDLAEERYEAQAKMWAGVTSVVLALGFNFGLGGGTLHTMRFPLPLAIGIGLVAVPLAPVAKDLSTSLQNALTAFKAIPGGKG